MVYYLDYHHLGSIKNYDTDYEDKEDFINDYDCPYKAVEASDFTPQFLITTDYEDDMKSARKAAKKKYEEAKKKHMTEIERIKNDEKYREERKREDAKKRKIAQRKWNDHLKRIENNIFINDNTVKKFDLFMYGETENKDKRELYHVVNRYGHFVYCGCYYGCKKFMKLNYHRNCDILYMQLANKKEGLLCRLNGRYKLMED